MRFSISKIALVVAFVFSLGGLSQAQTSNIARSDILKHIVTQCVDLNKKDYCSNCALPRVDSACISNAECRQTNEVWAMNQDYVAIRDIKMCGCSSDFVHGLALPRLTITGIEDPLREEGIWNFAWDVGLRRIEPMELALAINPKSERTQNQLHIHILRLEPKARILFPKYSSVITQNLDNVWMLAEQIAKSKGLLDYGVLVIKAQHSGYLVLVSPESPEGAFTQWKCDRTS